METDKYPHSILEEAISGLVKINAISITEHTQLITMLQNEMEEIISLEDASKSQEELKHNLIKLVRAWHKPEAVFTSIKSTDDNTSPLGTFLHEKKKRQHTEHELKISLAISEVKSIEESQDEH